MCLTVNKSTAGQLLPELRKKAAKDWRKLPKDKWPISHVVADTDEPCILYSLSRGNSYHLDRTGDIDGLVIWCVRDASEKLIALCALGLVHNSKESALLAMYVDPDPKRVRSSSAADDLCSRLWNTLGAYLDEHRLNCRVPLQACINKVVGQSGGWYRARLEEIGGFTLQALWNGFSKRDGLIITRDFNKDRVLRTYEESRKAAVVKAVMQGADSSVPLVAALTLGDREVVLKALETMASEARDEAKLKTKAAELASLGVVPLLRGVLATVDPEIKTHVAVVLGDLVRRGQGRTIADDAGEDIVKLLIDMLRSESPKGALYALKELAKLAVELVVAADGLSPLLSLLNSNDPDVRLETVETLKSMMVDAGARDAIITSGANAIPTLVGLFGCEYEPHPDVAPILALLAESLELAKLIALPLMDRMETCFRLAEDISKETEPIHPLDQEGAIILAILAQHPDLDEQLAAALPLLRALSKEHNEDEESRESAMHAWRTLTQRQEAAEAQALLSPSQLLPSSVSDRIVDAAMVRSGSIPTRIGPAPFKTPC